MPENVECYICGSDVDKQRAVLVWRHPADGSPSAQVWLCEFCQDTAQDEELDQQYSED